MNDSVVSVVIPVADEAPSLGRCLDAVARQDFPQKELIVVCDARAGGVDSLPAGSEDVRVIRETGTCTMGRLINRGMCAARGHVKVLLMPHCVPAGASWLSCMVQPFDREDVGVVVSQCLPLNPSPTLAARVHESIDPARRENTDGQPRAVRTVSHLCDAYRASLLADVGYFEDDQLASPGEAIDMSLKIADTGYAILLSNGAVAHYDTPLAHNSVRAVLSSATDYGYSDALLDKKYDLRWLNSCVYAAAFFSLFLLPLGVLKLPLAVVLGLGIFAWGWFLGVRLPVVGWDCLLFTVNFGAYAAIVLAIRDGWSLPVLGTTVHPAIMRQWALLIAIAGTYLIILLATGARAAARGLSMHRGGVYALPVMLLAILWWLAAGLGYLRGAWLERKTKE